MKKSSEDKENQPLKKDRVVEHWDDESVENLQSSRQNLVFAKPKKKSANELKSVKHFKSLASLQKKPASRYNTFAMVLGTPDVPRLHPGVDHSYHPDKDIDHEWLDLLEHGHSTLKYLDNDKRNKTCPHLLFLRTGVTADEDPLSKQIFKDHTLDSYRQIIANERQLPIQFFFSGHGTPRKIGSISLDKRFSPEEFADLFDSLVDAADLKEVLLAKTKPLLFHFDTCSSAYVDLSDIDTGNTSDEDLRQIIKTKLLGESIIGKFFQAMNELGYTNINVVGYRGYFQAMSAGSGARVMNSLSDPTVETAAQNALHSIGRDKRGTVVITLPKRLRNATFDVVFPGAQRPTP